MESHPWGGGSEGGGAVRVGVLRGCFTVAGGSQPENMPVYLHVSVLKMLL